MGDGIPSWLDEKFLAASLQGEQCNEPKVSIFNFKIAPPTTIDGYSSDIFRVHVNYRREHCTQEQSKYLVVKVPDSTGLINILLGPISCEKEHLCYKVLLPKMMSKVKCAFAAESFHSIVDKVIVMEDLGKEYRLADRSKQLDFEHCKLVWATLAKYHASSVAIHDKNKEVIDFVATEVFFPEGGVLRQWIELGNRTLGESLEKKGHKEYADVFLSRIENIWDNLVENVKPQPGRLNVLNHGDLWLNNLFFKYNEAKEPVEVRFIDFQASRYSLPVMDLVYFLYGNAQYDVREYRQKELYSHYLEVLNRTLEELGRSERFTEQQLKEDLKSSIPWFIGILIFSVSLIVFSEFTHELPFNGLVADDFVSGKANPAILHALQGEEFNSRLPHYVRQYLAFIES
uniref:CHK kinase-like domain-containing protein n=2 Tax=Homalodisca liturata TaxID=320908 RepID=A0A1B6HI31_9HEMI